MNEKIAIVDDEIDIIELIKINLKKSNYIPYAFQKGEDILKFVEKNYIDLAIIDLMLPDMDGIEIVKKLKEIRKNLPVIILTAKGEEFDRVLGLEIGADDYIVKPFSIRELIARIRALLRRVEVVKEDKDVIKINKNFIIYPKKFEVLIDKDKINLTSTEFKILLILIKKRGEVLSRNEILDELWGMDKIVIDRTIDVHIKNLREKLKHFKDYIKNIRGVGYKFEI
ncbi:MAG: response regulator transcription factor [Caldisericia bacterium]